MQVPPSSRQRTDSVHYNLHPPDGEVVVAHQVLLVVVSKINLFWIGQRWKRINALPHLSPKI